MWVYLRSESSLWTVGFYAPDGQWHAESDHTNQEAAAKRVAWLNGGDARTLGRTREVLRFLLLCVEGMDQDTLDPDFERARDAARIILEEG